MDDAYIEERRTIEPKQQAQEKKHAHRVLNPVVQNLLPLAGREERSSRRAWRRCVEALDSLCHAAQRPLGEISPDCATAQQPRRSKPHAQTNTSSTRLLKSEDVRWLDSPHIPMHGRESKWHCAFRALPKPCLAALRMTDSAHRGGVSAGIHFVFCTSNMEHYSPLLCSARTQRTLWTRRYGKQTRS